MESKTRASALLLLGPTGSGKTPLGEACAARGLAGRPCRHFDFGARLRAVHAAGSPHPFLSPAQLMRIGDVLRGNALLEEADLPIAGALLNDFLTVGGEGFSGMLVLNGFPRHAGQARFLADRIAVERVVALELDETAVRERLRRDPAGDRAGRADDAEAEVVRKLAIWRERTAPLLEYYSNAGVPVVRLEVAPGDTGEDIRDRLERMLESSRIGLKADTGGLQAARPGKSGAKRSLCDHTQNQPAAAPRSRRTSIPRGGGSRGGFEQWTKAAEVQREIRRLSNPAQAALLMRYFKTGPGQYGEGDVFLGLKVPQVRGVAGRARELSLPEIRKLLRSSYHEERLCALVILTLQYPLADQGRREMIFQLYLRHTALINNWDLVDVSAPLIVGAHLEGKPEQDWLDPLALSESLWERRIALLATLHFIRRGELAPTFRLARMLLADPEDLIHKAAGWMLREAGKRDREKLEKFLAAHGRRMPRTMLRYAIEKFSAAERRRWLGAGKASPKR